MICGCPWERHGGRGFMQGVGIVDGVVVDSVVE